MSDLKEIKAKEGLGILKFGVTRDSVKMILGEPDEKDTEQDLEGEYESETWHYDEHELSLQFDEEHGWRLTTIAVSHSDYNFEGESLIGMNRLELVNFLKGKGYDDIVLDELGEDEGEILAVDSLYMNFWIDQDVVSEILWNPAYDEDTEMIVWP